MSEGNELFTAIEGIGKSFESFKEINDKRIEEERKGNEARAKELSESLEKVSAELTDNSKSKQLLEKRIAAQQDRLELLEAMNDRPKATIQDRIRSEHKDLLFQWVRSRGEDQDAVRKLRELSEKAREVKDVSIATNSAGGFAVPEEIARAVDKKLLALSQVTTHVKNVQAGTSDYKELVSVNTSGSAWVGEAGSRTKKDSPELRQRTPTWGELYAFPRASNWSLQDMFFDVEAWLIDSIAEDTSNGLSTAIWNGNGSDKPTGFIQGTPVTTADHGVSPERAEGAFQYIGLNSPSSPTSKDGFGSDDVIRLVYALNPRYRGNARFAANTVTQGFMRRLKDEDGQYLWQPSLQADQPDRLLGYEIFTWEDMGNPTTNDAYPLAFGDFNKAYTLVTRSGMQIIRDDVTVPGFTNYYVSRRFGGIVTNNHALKLLRVAD